MRSTRDRYDSAHRVNRGSRRPGTDNQPSPWQSRALAAAFILALLVVVMLDQSWLALALIGASAAVAALFQRRDAVTLVPARARVSRSAPSRCVWKLDTEA